MEDQRPDRPKENFQDIARASSLSLALDNYEDIFSDFDPRPYSVRMLSEDFLHELNRASQHQETDGLVVTLWMAKEKRNNSQEKVILDRLKGHFRRNHRRLEEKRRTDQKTGFKMVALGVVFMSAATYLLTYSPQSLWRSFIVVLLEPAGWFTFWEGLSLIFFYSKEATPDLGFYQKMSGAKVLFASTSADNPERPKS